MDELNLTPRERQVAELFILGLPIIAIGKRLAMAPGTVKVHISRARFKNRACPLFRDRRGWSVNEPLKAFFRWVMQATWRGEDIDGGDVQAKAVELGLPTWSRMTRRSTGYGKARNALRPVSRGACWISRVYDD